MIENYFQNINIHALSRDDRDKADLYLKIAEKKPINWDNPYPSAVKMAIGFIRIFDNNPIVAAKKVCFALERASEIDKKEFHKYMDPIPAKEYLAMRDFEKETGEKHPVLEEIRQKSCRKADEYLNDNLHVHLYNYLDKVNGIVD